MKRVFFKILAIYWISFFAWGVKGESAENDLAFSLYGKVKSEQGNLIFSPVGLNLAMGMAYLGSKGETAQEIEQVMHWPQKLKLENYFQDLQKRLAREGETQLTLANSLWLQKGYQIQKAYKKAMQKNFASTPSLVDFTNQREVARLTINQWVEKKTHKMITDFIPPNVITSLTRLIVVNAIYFKGSWDSPFEKENTANKEFFPLSGGPIKWPMMFGEKELGHYEDQRLLAVEIPYVGNEMTLLAVMPKKQNGFKEFEDEMKPSLLEEIQKQLNKEKIILEFPKFETSQFLNLKPILQELGLHLAFSDEADFSLISGKKDLKIESVIQKAKIIINEEGTEAAAASGVFLGRKSLSAPPKFVSFNRPFVFFLLDKKSGSIVFMGRFVGKA